jgi:hypothetical protein
MMRRYSRIMTYRLRPILFGALCSAIVLATSAQGASAKFCGDDIDGTRVACDCGDVVGSDTKLRPSDPVVTQRCSGFGLIIRAKLLDETITFDMDGLSIRGEGRAFGLFVDRGGSDGATIVGGPPGKRGELVGFGTGLTVGASGALKRLERLRASGNHSEGIWMRQSGAIVSDVEVSDNGGNGLQIVGRGGRFTGITAQRNGRNGVDVDAANVQLTGEIQENARHGVVAQGQRSDVNGVVARNNGGHGILLSQGRHLTDDTVAYANGREGIKRSAKRNAR